MGSASKIRSERFGRLVERDDGRDFPLYGDEPVATWRWVVVIGACAVGLAVLLVYPAQNDVQSLVARVLFTAIPLATFIAVVGRGGAGFSIASAPATSERW